MGDIEYTDLTDISADERIEKLLNRFGQTISDLPKPSFTDFAYSYKHRQNARKAAYRFDYDEDGEFNKSSVDDYICHLADVIDRMESALENAARYANCISCEELYEPCHGCCTLGNNNYRMADELLVGGEIRSKSNMYKVKKGE